MNQVSTSIIVLLLLIRQAYGQNIAAQKGAGTQPSEYLTFKLSDQVIKQNVQYKNRYGITIAAQKKPILATSVKRLASRRLSLRSYISFPTPGTSISTTEPI